MSENISDPSSTIDIWLKDAVEVIQTSVPSDETRTALYHALTQTNSDFSIQETTDDQSRPMFPLFKKSALTMDEHFIATFGGSDTLFKEYDRNRSVLFFNRLVSLALLLREYDADKTRDLYDALVKRARVNGGEDLPIPDLHHEEILQWILGRERYSRWKKRFGYQYEEYVQRLVTIIDRSEGIRRKFLLALDRFATMPTQFLANAIGRQGWVYLAENTKEITDHEYCTIMEREAESKERDAVLIEVDISTLERSERKYGGIAKRAKNPETIKKYTNIANGCQHGIRVLQESVSAIQKEKDRICESVRSFREANPETVPARTFIDIIDWRGWQEKLQFVRSEDHATRLGALQKQIALDVFFHVQQIESGRQEYVSSAEENQNGVPDYIRGFPVEIVKRREASCFGGLWLIASLLLKCGIRPEQLRFCHINKDYDGQIGAHENLLLLTENKEILIIDFGHNVCGRELILSGCMFGKTFLEMQQLMNGTRTEPVIWNADPYFTKRWKYSQSMIVMPVMEGFAHVHLWHTGIGLLHEGKIKEAEEAFRIAWSLCPQNPDVLYYLGLVASQAGDLKSAKAYLHDAIAVFKEHLLSHEALGRIALLEGDEGEALRRFTLVATDENSIWGDNTFKRKAIEYRELWQKDHPEAPEEPLTYQI